MSGPAPALALRQLHKRFGRTEIIRGANLEVQALSLIHI